MQTLTKISPEEYLENEEKADVKSEYRAGEVLAMSGAQLAHNRIVSNLIYLLNQCLWDTDCEVFPSDMLLKLPECELFTYPDVMVACGEIQLDKDRRQGLDVLLNPSIVIEVLSKSTADYDRGEKMRCYLTLPSLQQYVLINSESFDVSTYLRNNENEWLLKIFKNLSEKIKIGDCEIALEDIYKKVKL